MALNKDDSKKLKQIGHHLKPVVTVGNNGLTDNVLMELNRALNDHELIKIKLSHEDRDVVLAQLTQDVDLTVVQAIGNIALVYRAAEKPNPKLSNILRHS